MRPSDRNRLLRCCAGKALLLGSCAEDALHADRPLCQQQMASSAWRGGAAVLAGKCEQRGPVLENAHVPSLHHLFENDAIACAARDVDMLNHLVVHQPVPALASLVIQRQLVHLSSFHVR